MEIHTQAPIEIEYVGFIPQVYPVTEKKVILQDALDQKIYDACVNSLKLCMMEHYVDTPWREQCLYVYDSRNQALCGYKAFEGVAKMEKQQPVVDGCGSVAGLTAGVTLAATAAAGALRKKKED